MFDTIKYLNYLYLVWRWRHQRAVPHSLLFNLMFNVHPPIFFPTPSICFTIQCQLSYYVTYIYVTILSKMHNNADINLSKKISDTSNSGSGANHENQVPVPLIIQLNFGDEMQPTAEPTIPHSQPISVTQQATASPSTKPTVVIASSQENRNNIQSGIDLQCLLPLHQQTLSRQQDILSSMRVRRNDL